jgi:glycosyltransferase involved in cell wall biosynthesis
MTNTNPSISLVIPVCQAEHSLHKLIDRIIQVMEQQNYLYEVILVNDGSTDRSWQIIEEISKTRQNVKGINLMRNFGQHNALLCGIRAAENQIIVTLDDDLQHPPEEIPKLLQKLSEEYDVIYATPHQEQHSFLRNIASQIAKLTLQHAMGAETAKNITAFRAFRTELRNAFADFQGPFVSIDVLLTWGTTRFCAIKVEHNRRATGTSNYTLKKLFTHCFNMLTGFSTMPLQLASMVGFFFTLFGIGVLIYVIGRYLILGYSIPGFPFVASIIAIFSGAQLFALGIIGEYLSRMHFRTMNRPAYIIRSETKK